MRLEVKADLGHKCRGDPTIAIFDCAGAIAEGLTMGMPVVCLGITTGLTMLSVIRR